MSKLKFKASSQSVFVLTHDANEGEFVTNFVVCGSESSVEPEIKKYMSLNEDLKNRKLNKVEDHYEMQEGNGDAGDGEVEFIYVTSVPFVS